MCRSVAFVEHCKSAFFSKRALPRFASKLGPQRAPASTSSDYHTTPMLQNAQYPFHCLRYAGGFIVASAGPNLYSYSASDGRKLFTWPESKTSISSEAETNDAPERSDEPPEKRRKISPTSAANDDNNNNNNRAIEKNNKTATAWSSIPVLVPSPSGRHVVAVTAEDKHIRVFDINSEGVLTQLNAR